MSVAQYCRTHFATATSDESVRAAARRMDEKDVGCVVVVDEHGHPIGMLTDRDIAVRALRRGRSADETQIAEIMNTEVTSVRDSVPLMLALRRMRSDGVRRIPVLGPGRKLVGVLEWSDVLGVIADDLRLAADIAAAQRTAGAS